MGFMRRLHNILNNPFNRNISCPSYLTLPLKRREVLSYVNLLSLGCLRGACDLGEAKEGKQIF
jgi:hypothetical protein